MNTHSNLFSPTHGTHSHGHTHSHNTHNNVNHNVNVSTIGNQLHSLNLTNLGNNYNINQSYQNYNYENNHNSGGTSNNSNINSSANNGNSNANGGAGNSNGRLNLNNINNLAHLGNLGGVNLNNLNSFNNINNLGLSGLNVGGLSNLSNINNINSLDAASYLNNGSAGGNQSQSRNFMMHENHTSHGGLTHGGMNNHGHGLNVNQLQAQSNNSNMWDQQNQSNLGNGGYFMQSQTQKGNSHVGVGIGSNWDMSAQNQVLLRSINQNNFDSQSLRQNPTPLHMQAAQNQIQAQQKVQGVAGNNYDNNEHMRLRRTNTSRNENQNQSQNTSAQLNLGQSHNLNLTQVQNGNLNINGNQNASANVNGYIGSIIGGSVNVNFKQQNSSISRPLNEFERNEKQANGGNGNASGFESKEGGVQSDMDSVTDGEVFVGPRGYVYDYKGKKVEIRNVWADNLQKEMAIIRSLLPRYSFVAMDTEFPGVVARPIGIFAENKDYNYQTLRCNVDLLNLIQLGIAFADKDGNLAKYEGSNFDDEDFAEGAEIEEKQTSASNYADQKDTKDIAKEKHCCCWQFHFRFSLKDDMYAQDSIDLLKRSGLDFKLHEHKGIDVQDFGDLMISSGLVLMPDIHWISFHGSYDFGYLLKVLTCDMLPEKEEDFFELLRMFFPNIYDVKHMVKKVKDNNGLQVNFKGGLNKLADLVQAQRIGPMHQAGSDSLLTLTVFFEMKEKYFKQEEEGFKNVMNIIHGLGTGNLDDDGERVSIMSPTFTGTKIGAMNSAKK